ncbi:hypothetical protein BGZ82_001624 [Podila clonocystis]|nr:hypothetical protein BGZ82_001624 [Podila clonocystis]
MLKPHHVRLFDRDIEKDSLATGDRAAILAKLRDDLELARNQTGVPGLSVAIVHKGKPIFTEGVDKRIQKNPFTAENFPPMQIPWLWSTDSRWDLVMRIRHVKFDPKPHSTFNYNNVMYPAAGEAAANVAGVPVEELLHSKVLKLLDLDNIGFSVSAMSNTSNFAVILSEGKVDGKQVLSKEGVVAILAVHTISQASVRNPDFGLSRQYGMGWQIGSYKDNNFYKHDMANSILSERIRDEPPARELSDFSGKYVDSGHGMITFYESFSTVLEHPGLRLGSLITLSTGIDGMVSGVTVNALGDNVNAVKMQ